MISATGGVVAAPLLGRDPELESLRSVVASVAGGTPATVLLTGPPGVGKTRLAEEALALAGAAGFAAFAGRAHELGRDVAYAPLVTAFGPALRAAAEGRRATLIGDLPQLGLLFTGLGLADSTPLRDPSLQRARLMDGLSRLVERLARERPLALVVDDVHAADDSTTAFLRYLTESVTDRPILLIATARPDEPGSSRLSTLTRGLAAASWTSERLTIAPLAPVEARAIVDGVLGHRTDERLGALIVDRCAGRPLFLEALTRTLAESGRLAEDGGVIHLTGDDVPLPDAVRDQLRIRLTGVPADERALLDLLAVAGAEVEFPLLAQAGQLTASQALHALDRLHRRGLLGAGSSTMHYDLVHGLLRDTLRAELSPAAAARAHGALADALIRHDPDDSRIAEQVLRAGPLVDAEQALTQLTRGAQHATRLAATDDAARYLTAALAVARVLGRNDVIAGLLAELGTAQQWRGNVVDASAAWTDAVAEYTRAGDAVGIARSERELGMLCWRGADLQTAREHFAFAERALDGLEPSPAHAEMLYATMIVASRVGDTATVRHAAYELRTLAEQLGSPALSAQAYLAEAVIDYADTDYLLMIEHNLRGLEAAERSGDAMLVSRAYDQLSVATASQLDIPELRRYTFESLRVARELGAKSLEPWPRSRLAVADLLTGNWDAALRAAAENIAMARRHGEHRGAVSSSAGYAWVLVHRGRLDDARKHLADARSAARPMLQADRNIFSIVALADASLALSEGNAARAVECAAQLEDATGGWMPLLGLAVLGEARASSGDTDGARLIADRFRAVRSCTTVAPETLGNWVDALTDAQGAQRDSAAERFRAAAGGFGSLGLPFLAARAQLGAASAEADAHPVQAIELARTALEAFADIGAPIQAQQSRELLRALGVVPSRGRGRQRTGVPLSARELEVARLVASGLSNAEVATALFISPRTVTTHLDRIYHRLELSSRVALTRYLADSGLLDEDG